MLKAGPYCIDGPQDVCTLDHRSTVFIRGGVRFSLNLSEGLCLIVKTAGSNGNRIHFSPDSASQLLGVQVSCYSQCLLASV